MTDTYLETVQSVLSLHGKSVLEVGCGNGSRTVQIGLLCAHVIAIDPDEEKIRQAEMEHPFANVEYKVASAVALPSNDKAVDVVIFTLSFHHVPPVDMRRAIDEALRIVKPDGYIIFFEPAFAGSFFDAETMFDACDGDERWAKATAYAAMLGHEGLSEVSEMTDQTVFRFESMDDFMETMHPKKFTRNAVKDFLVTHEYLLRAERRINIFRPTHT